jgi:polar amino acid transport system substrate-binding protein
MKKKLVALVLVATMALSAVACGSKDDAASTGDGKETLVMATNAEFPPYEYIDGDMYYGIDVEVAKIIADKLGYDLVIENVAFDSIIPGVQAGKYDMGMAGMTVTPERLESVEFSSSYAKGIQAVIVKEDGKIQAIEDLDPFYLPAE